MAPAVRASINLALRGRRALRTAVQAGPSGRGLRWCLASSRRLSVSRGEKGRVGRGSSPFTRPPMLIEALATDCFAAHTAENICARRERDKLAGPDADVTEFGRLHDLVATCSTSAGTGADCAAAPADASSSHWLHKPRRYCR